MNDYRTGRLAIPPVVKGIIIINVILFLLTYMTGSVGQHIGSRLALYNLESPNFEPYQLITHMFMHGGFGHIFFNMFAVFIFGRVLENVWGGKRFFIFYMITGLGAALILLLANHIQLVILQDKIKLFQQSPAPEVLQKLVEHYIGHPSMQFLSFIEKWTYQPDNASYIQQGKEWATQLLPAIRDIPTIGASGAVFGVLVAFAMMFPDVELMLIFFPVPIKAKYMVPFYALVELFFGVAHFQWDNVAHWAHLGGALVGFIMVKIWKRNQFNIY
jgi:membrane associated rhomboid family serine protease